MTHNEQQDVPAQQNHGTATLSIMAANAPGFLMGAAPNASFLVWISNLFYRILSNDLGVCCVISVSEDGELRRRVPWWRRPVCCGIGMGRSEVIQVGRVHYDNRRPSHTADHRGADMASASLGYSQWYTWANMDGTQGENISISLSWLTSKLFYHYWTVWYIAVTTKAVNMAVSKGIVVLISAGNSGVISHSALWL